MSLPRARVVTLNAALGPLDYRVPDGMAVEPGSVVVAPLGLPGDADQLARTERGDDHRTRLDRHAFGYPIVKRTEGGVKSDDTGAGKGHELVIARSGATKQSSNRAA